MNKIKINKIIQTNNNNYNKMVKTCLKIFDEEGKIATIHFMLIIIKKMYSKVKYYYYANNRKKQYFLFFKRDFFIKIIRKINSKIKTFYITIN